MDKWKWIMNFVEESWKIEGLRPTFSELSDLSEFHEEFLAKDYITVSDIINAAFTFTDGKGRLRDKKGMDVRVGSHRPPAGGSNIIVKLQELISLINKETITDEDAWNAHHEFETLHPFMDGNGRTGRLIWAWMMNKSKNRYWRNLGFLHTWYYQSLQFSRSDYHA